MLQPVRTKWKRLIKAEFMEMLQNKFYKLWCLCTKALSPDRVTGKQIEAARVALTRHEKTRKSLDKNFPNIPVSKKPIEVRMGKVKGHQSIMLVSKTWKVLFEVDGVLGILLKKLYIKLLLNYQ